MNCSGCGTPLPPEVIYCPKCGTPTPAYYSSAGTGPNAPTVPSSPYSVPPPVPSTSYGPQPYGAAPPPYSVPPPVPYDPYRAVPPASPPPPSPRRGSRAWLFAGVALIVLVLIVGGVVAVLRPGALPISSTTPAQATATAHAEETATITSALTATVGANATATASVIAANPDPYPPTSGKLALYDPLSDNTKGYSWDTGTSASGTCAFTGQAYHVSPAKTPFFYVCAANATNFNNFAFEVQMEISKGDCGGLIFRADSSSGKLYFFDVCQDGSYHLYLYMDYSGNHTKVLAGGSSPPIKTGLGQSNVLAVVAQGNTLDLYVNKQKVTSASDGTYSQGQIGLVGDSSSNPTEVVFSNAKVWTL